MTSRWHRVTRRLGSVVLNATATLLLILLLAPAGRAQVVGADAGRWILTDWTRIPAGHADQGLATVWSADGRSHLVLRGNADLTPAMARRGWWHIGDPGSRDGYLVDVYQSANRARGKLFRVTAPDGRVTDWVHHLLPGEMVNNSFAAISPDGRWLVSGEWGTVSRLLVFPMPELNPAARAGRDLPLAAVITLSHPVRNVQGCSFASATRLVCSTNDTGTTLFPVPRQLLAVDLAAPLAGRPAAGTVALLGAVPQASGCGPSETEGIDVSGGTLRVVAREPGLCSGSVDVFTYTRAGTPLGSSHAHPGS